MSNLKTRLALIVLTFGIVLLGVGQSTVTLGVADSLRVALAAGRK